MAAKRLKQSFLKVRLLQWNILADGLGNDGFLTTEFSPICESLDPDAKGYTSIEFMKMVREAKLADKRSGATETFANLKIEEKKLKKMKLSGEFTDSVEDVETKISELKEKANQSRLVQLKKQFQNSPQLAKIDEEILAWSMRYDRIKAIVLCADPDIITFQEMDHVKQFMDDVIFASKYTCVVDKSKTYSPASYSMNGSNDDLSSDKYLQHLLDSRTAFAPKSYSNAYMLRSKRSKLEIDLDDDGVVVFWKKSIFQPVELGFLQLPQDHKDHAVVALTLKHLETKELINVLTSHLPAGDDPKKEKERLDVLNNPSKKWAARRICVVDNVWKEVPYERVNNFVGTASFVRYFAERIDVDTSRTIFALDANSRPTFPLTEHDPSSTETNVWQTILRETKLKSIWVQSSFLNQNGTARDSEYPYIVSVNKMRGPSSSQPSKIGEHQLELIDHVFSNGLKSILLREIDLNANVKVPMAPILYKSKGEKAELNLYPTSKMPSDHLPIIVDITL
jgi:hypothetical protein